MSRILLAGLTLLLVACSSSNKPASSEPVAQTATVESKTPAALKDLIGARGRDGEAGMQQAGYEYRSTAKTGTSSNTYWRSKDGGCVEVTTTDGRYAAITTVDKAKCEEDGSAVVAASGKPGAKQTVCGVIVGGKTTRYLCEVEENRVGTTVLRMPDTVLKLTWNLGSKSVSVEQDGMNPTVVRYAEGEGETNFRLDQRTFFYISNPSLAEMEVKNFKK